MVVPKTRVAWPGQRHLNFADVMAAQGPYADAPKPPCVVGYEVAGVIDALGDGPQGSCGRRAGAGHDAGRRPTGPPAWPAGSGTAQPRRRGSRGPPPDPATQDTGKIVLKPRPSGTRQSRELRA
jgi:hypothetical protein